MSGSNSKLFDTVIKVIAKSDSPNRFKTLQREAKKIDLKKTSKLDAEINEDAAGTSSFLTNDQSKDTQKLQWKRSNMGHYIYDRQNGGRPLTVGDLSSPGPADYEPDFTKRSQIKTMPKYSIRPAFPASNRDSGSPGPKYETSPGVLQKYHKQVTIKGRHPTQFTQGVGPGPGEYLSSYNTVGSKPNYLKTTLKKRIDGRHRAGFNSVLEEPVESPGYLNTQEQFLIDKTAKSVRFGDAPKWTLVGKPICATVDGPGPAGYGVPSEPHREPAPGTSMTARPLHDSADLEDATPGPSEYLPSFADKQSNPRAIVLPRRELTTGKYAPAPNEYHINGQYDKVKKCYDFKGPNITYRHHSSSENDASPGPSSYNPHHGYKISGGAFFNGNRKAPTCADCLLSKTNLTTTKAIPGACAYYPQNHCISSNSRPKYTFGTSRKPTKLNDRPGPANYSTRNLTKTGYSPAPKFSFGGRGVAHAGKATAGGEYHSMPSPSYGISYSIRGRNSKSGVHTGGSANLPGPQYNLRGMTRTGKYAKCNEGVSLTSRCSPHVYSPLGHPVRLQQSSVLTNIHLG